MVLPRKNNLIVEKSDAFSDRIIKMYKYLVDHHNDGVIARQILKSGTSIGANVAESRNAQSRSDFVSKLSIALKEADETLYWLKKLLVMEWIKPAHYESMASDHEEIIKILTKIIKTTKGIE